MNGCWVQWTESHTWVACDGSCGRCVGSAIDGTIPEAVPSNSVRRVVESDGTVIIIEGPEA
jgi:hypothetical protein